MSDKRVMHRMEAPKPEIAVAQANGVVRLVGVGAAAKWLGLSASTIRNIAAGRGVVMGYSEGTVARVEKEYPQIKGVLIGQRGVRRKRGEG